MIKQNPITILCYLFFVIFITMFSTNPIMLGISFMSAILLYCSLQGLKKTAIKLGYSIVFVVIVMAINPLFSKQGMNVLFYIGELVVTLEAISYGIAIGVMFSSVMIWFSIINVLLDSDKISYIFSKYTPKIGTILSVSLGLFPKYIAQYKKIDNNLKGLGLYEKVNFLGKIRLKLHAMSTLITWSIEGTLTLSDSMSARGYDLKGKRVFLRYKFNLSDIVMLLLTLACGITLLVFMGIGSINYYYYPTFKKIVWDSNVWIYFVTFAFMNVMLLINEWGRIKWQFTISRI